MMVISEHTFPWQEDAFANMKNLLNRCVLVNFFIALFMSDPKNETNSFNQTPKSTASFSPSTILWTINEENNNKKKIFIEISFPTNVEPLEYRDSKFWHSVYFITIMQNPKTHQKKTKKTKKKT